MPRGKKTNKSQEIRDMLKLKPNATVREVVQALAQKQVTVQPSQVYMVKGRLKQMKVHRNRRKTRMARAGQKTGSTDPIALILRVKELVRDAGGLENLKTLISVLE